MRAVVSLIVVAVMMGLFHHLTAGGLLEARATLALGFLLIAAQLGADILSRWKLPRLTGYIAIGFIFGPAWLGFVRADEAHTLGFIADAAVALARLELLGYVCVDTDGRYGRTTLSPPDY